MMGRPPLSLDMHKIFQLSHSHTQREIGAMFGVAHTTISRRLKKYRPVKRTPKQCVIIRHRKNYTQYILVGKKIHTLYHVTV